MADTELKIRVSAQLADAKQALESITKQLAQIAQGGAQLGAAATAGFDRMEAAAERAAKATADVAAAATRMGEAIEKANAKSSKPPTVPKALPTPKPPKAPLAEGVADQNAVQRAALKQQLVDLEASHKAGLTSERAYYQQRASIQRAALTAELAQARAMQAAATTQEARNRAATRIATLTQQRTAISAAPPVTAAALPAVAGVQKDALGLGSILGKVQGAAAALGITLGVLGTSKAFITLAEDAKRLEGRLRLATNSTDEFNIANAQLFEIAQRTRSSFGDLVALYARLSMSTKQLGTSQAELLRATETISKALRLSFTGSAESANAALMQLGQGLAAGTLRGDELNSVLEQAPRLAQAIAEGMGITTGELKKLGEAGKITAQNVLGALRNQAAGIDAEFKTLPRDISGAMTVLTNSLTKGAGEIDRVSGITDTLSGSLESLGPVVERVASKIAEHFARASVLGGDAMQKLTKDAGSLAVALDDKSALQQALDGLGEGFSRFFEKVSKEVNAAFARDMATMAASTIRANAEAKRLSLTFGLVKTAFSTMFSPQSAAAAWRNYSDQMAKVRKEMEAGLKGIETNMNNLLKAGDKAVEKMRGAAAASQKLADTKPVEPMGPPRPPPPIVGKVDFREVQKQQLAQQLEDLKRAYDLELLSTEDYYAKRLALQQRALNLEIGQAAAARDKATTPDAKSTALTDMAKLQQQKLRLVERHNQDLADLSGGRINFTLIAADEVRVGLEDLKRAYDQSLIATEDYYDQRLQLQLRGLQLEQDEEDKAFRRATTVDAKSASRTRSEALERRAIELSKQAVEGIEDDAKKTTTTVSELRTRLLAAEGQSVAARNAEIEAQYVELKKKLTAEGNQEGLGLLAKLIGYEQGKAQLDQLGTDVDKVIAEFRAAEESAANSVLTGQSTQRGASTAVVSAADEAVPRLEKYREELAKLAPMSATAAEKLRDVDAAIASIGAKSQGGMQRALSNLRVELAGLQTSFQSDAAFALRDNLKTLFDDIITGSKNAGEALRDFAKNFAKAILSMITQILATQAAKAILSRGGGLLGIAGSALGAVKHAGGVVGDGGGPMRSVPVAAFFGAPRLHSGGTLGLSADEVPTILQRGEEVLAKGDPRNVRNGGAGAGAGVGGGPIMVMLHPDHNHRTMRDWLESELARVTATS